jgi:DNA-binding PucR family transcriptional regulator
MRRSVPSTSATAHFLDLRYPPPSEGIAIADRADHSEWRDGELLLTIGLPASEAAAVLDAHRAPASAGMVLRSYDPATDARLTDIAHRRGIPLYWLPPGVGWDEAHRALTDRSPVQHPSSEDLSDLAQTIATLTGGLVTIEDPSARVLAYSRSDDAVDDLRRLSILGSSGPPAYLELLRTWGVYDRLAVPDQVVEIEEHPQSGIRRRLAVGIFAAGRQLGTIWVQQGGEPLAPRARDALLGAARLAAPQLADRNARSWRQGDRDVADLQAMLAGSDPRRTDTAWPQTIVVCETGAPADDPAAHRLALDALRGIIAVHAAAYRHRTPSLVADERVYLLLPGGDPAQAGQLVSAIVEAARRHVSPRARAGIGQPADSARTVAASRRTADLALDHSPAAGRPVTAFTDVRSALIVDEAVRAVDALGTRPEFVDPRLTALVHDHPELARTLLSYLDVGSSAQAAADELNLHVTTVRHRLQRAVGLLDLRLADGVGRLACHLQLLAELRQPATEG